MSLKVTTNQDGGAYFSPIQSDLLRTYHTRPQVNPFFYVVYETNKQKASNESQKKINK